jgi:hypothetical protein
MGNKTSTTNNSKLADEIDRIASKYILSQNFNDMNKLSEKDHCDKMVILTAKIIGENLPPLEQKVVVNRIQAPMNEEVKREEIKEPEIKKDEGEIKKDEKDIKKEEDKNLKRDDEEDYEYRKRKELDRRMWDDIDLIGGEEKSKEEDCLKIAKFYVKIAHIYAAIMKTVNPVITTRDKNGQKIKYDLMNKHNIPTDAEIHSIEHNNFCTRRLNNLIQEKDYNRNDSKNVLLSVKPRFCNMDYDTRTNAEQKFYVKDIPLQEIHSNTLPLNSVPSNTLPSNALQSNALPSNALPSNTLPSLAVKKGGDELKEEIIREENKNTQQMSQQSTQQPGEDISEIGIPELMKLYYDVYDPVVGDFTSMSDEMKMAYKEDVGTFYKTFTGKPIPTDENGDPLITRFEEIPLHEFHKSNECKPNGIYNKNFEGSLKDSLFKKYADHMLVMMNHMNSNQNKLLDILNKLFIFPKTEEDAVRINPDLDDTLLQSLVNSTRKLIIELYVTCEADFLQGIILFESIVAVQLAKTTASQIKFLNNMAVEHLTQ